MKRKVLIQQIGRGGANGGFKQSALQAMRGSWGGMPPEDLRAYLLEVLQAEDGVQLGGEGQEKKVG